MGRRAERIAATADDGGRGRSHGASTAAGTTRGGEDGAAQAVAVPHHAEGITTSPADRARIVIRSVCGAERIGGRKGAARSGVRDAAHCYSSAGVGIGVRGRGSAGDPHVRLLLLLLVRVVELAVRGAGGAMVGKRDVWRRGGARSERCGEAAGGVPMLRAVERAPAAAVKRLGHRALQLLLLQRVVVLVAR